MSATVVITGAFSYAGKSATRLLLGRMGIAGPSTALAVARFGRDDKLFDREISG
jgi:hypothetical protein